MQSHITFSTFSLKIEIIFVISAFLTCLLTGGCGKKEQTVFTETVYASGNGSYSVEESSGKSNYSAKGNYSGKSDYSGSEGDQTNGSGTSDRTGAMNGTTSEAGSRENAVCVFVCGAVNAEGVYELPERSRVIDAVEAAGGYSDDADRTYVNQAEYVYDTQRIEIPTKEEAQMLREYERDAGADNESGHSDGRIDLNTADKQALMTLPGIGESKADRILEYRQAHGRFGSTEELMNVSGIGSGVYEKIKDYIKV